MLAAAALEQVAHRAFLAPVESFFQAGGLNQPGAVILDATQHATPDKHENMERSGAQLLSRLCCR
jgi:hypothetical protein